MDNQNVAALRAAHDAFSARDTARFRAVGVQDGPMPVSPFPASHRPFSLDVCEVWRFGPDGKAVEGHNYSDGLGLLMQLGHVPALT
jgi:hypothetical protein